MLVHDKMCSISCLVKLVRFLVVACDLGIAFVAVFGVCENRYKLDDILIIGLPLWCVESHHFTTVWDLLF